MINKLQLNSIAMGTWSPGIRAAIEGLTVVGGGSTSCFSAAQLAVPHEIHISGRQGELPSLLLDGHFCLHARLTNNDMQPQSFRWRHPDVRSGILLGKML